MLITHSSTTLQMCVLYRCLYWSHNMNIIGFHVIRYRYYVHTSQTKTWWPPFWLNKYKVCHWCSCKFVNIKTMRKLVLTTVVYVFLFTIVIRYNTLTWPGFAIVVSMYNDYQAQSNVTHCVHVCNKLVCHLIDYMGKYYTGLVVCKHIYRCDNK